MRSWTVGLALLACGLAGCALVTKPIAGIEHVTAAEDYAARTRSALTGPDLSRASTSILHAFDLDRYLEDEPERALGLLHHHATRDPLRSQLFALAELSFRIGRDRGSRPHYMACAVYAYLYLFGYEAVEPPSPFDRRYRWACDLYERGLTEALRAADGEELVLESATWELPTGRLELAIDADAFVWDPAPFRFLPATHYRTWGLNWRPRDEGLGVPLIAHQEDFDEQHGRFDMESPPTRNVAATLLLELDGGLRQLGSGLPARLELHRTLGPETVELAGRRVPLERDFAATLAFGVTDERLWKYSVSGFFSQGELPHGLWRLEPYQPGLVPVVFVHGTASSPVYWAETVNSLWSDDLLRDRTQTWVFTYSTGNPILYSADKLRTALAEAVARLDPEGADPALRRMVLVGHSQGGLLVRLMVVSGDAGWWEKIYGSPLEDWDFEAEDEALVRRVLEFEPVDAVDRVVFISTPHRGSFVADSGLAHLLAKFVKLPSDVERFYQGVQAEEDLVPPELRGSIGTSVDNMDPDNPFSRRFTETRFAPGVHVHSIISVSSPGDPTTGDDGVVEYSSAYIDEAESEVIVPSPHSCQGHPLTILELRRILRQATGLPAPRSLP